MILGLHDDILTDAWLSKDSRGVHSHPSWREVHRRCRQRYRTPFEVVASTATRSDRLAWVVATAHFEALRHLVARAFTLERNASLCLHEKGSPSPLQMETFLDRTAGTLTGTKVDVTAAALADDFLVYVKHAPDESWAAAGFSLVLVPADRPGVSVVEDLFSGVRGLRRCRVIFDAVKVAPADIVYRHAMLHNIYMEYFPVVEDLFVVGGVLACFINLAKTTYQADEIHRVSALFSAARNLATLPTLADVYEPQGLTAAWPAASAICGLHEMTVQEVARFDWSRVSDETSERWTEDLAYLNVDTQRREQLRGRIAWAMKLVPPPVVVKKWTWDRGSTAGEVTLFASGRLEWAGWSNRPPFHGGGEDQDVHTFLDEGPPNWADEDVAEQVRALIVARSWPQ
jgi:hypothetical protein